MYTDLYGLETLSLRLFSVYGPGQNGKEEYATAIGRFKYLKVQNKPLVIYGSGNQTRDFTYVDDVVIALIKAMKVASPKERLINICSGKSYSINRIAKIIGGKILYHEARKGESKDICGSNKLALKLMGWRPRVSLEAGIRL